MAYTLREYLDYHIKYFIRRLRYRNGVTEVDEEEVKEMEERGYPNNYKKFPYNLYKPEIVTVDGDRYIRYNARFRSLHDLYVYLRSHPGINRKVFSTLSSTNGSTEFAGIPIEEAIEELNSPPRDEYRDFLRLSERLNSDSLGFVQEHITISAPGGGCIDIPAYASGNPFCYKIGRSIYTPKFVRINVLLSYYSGTTKEQILNRALIVAALVNAFEQEGYIVDVNTFEMSAEDNEIIDIDVNIKNNDETFNRASLYKTLCYVEFLRRILFRVLETMDVKNSWGFGYGHPCSESFVREAKRLDSTDIVIDQPREMGIYGKNIAEDFRNTIEHLQLGDKIDVTRAADEFEKDVLRLRKTIK